MVPKNPKNIRLVSKTILFYPPRARSSVCAGSSSLSLIWESSRMCYLASQAHGPWCKHHSPKLTFTSKSLLLLDWLQGKQSGRQGLLCGVPMLYVGEGGGFWALLLVVGCVIGCQFSHYYFRPAFSGLDLGYFCAMRHCLFFNLSE